MKLKLAYAACMILPITFTVWLWSMNENVILSWVAGAIDVVLIVYLMWTGPRSTHAGT